MTVRVSKKKGLTDNRIRLGNFVTVLERLMTTIAFYPIKIKIEQSNSSDEMMNNTYDDSLRKLRDFTALH
jgi:hypothetical protein